MFGGREITYSLIPTWCMYIIHNTHTYESGNLINSYEYGCACVHDVRLAEWKGARSIHTSYTICMKNTIFTLSRTNDNRIDSSAYFPLTYRTAIIHVSHFNTSGTDIHKFSYRQRMSIAVVTFCLIYHRHLYTFVIYI